MLRKKLVINLVVVIVCGIIALSVPVIANQLQKPTKAIDSATLIYYPVNDNLHDATYWQLELRTDQTTVATWKQIYDSVLKQPSLLRYDQDKLQLQSYGLVNKQTTADNTPTVVYYKQYYCEIKFN